jgi:type I restriction enzyme, S subunit
MNSRLLGDICDFAYGDSLPEERRRGGIVPVYGSNGVVGRHNSAITSGPTIVIGRKGSIGEIRWSDKPCFPIDTTYYIETTKLPCELRWLYYALLQLDLTRFNKSAAVPGLNREDAYEKRIQFPTVAEQSYIAAQLDQADRLRRTRRYTLELSESFLPATFRKLFGSQATPKEGVDIRPLGEYLSFVTSGARGWAEHYTSTGSRFIRSLDVRMNEIPDEDAAFVIAPKGAEADRTRVLADDVLLTITGSQIGRVAPVPEKLAGAYVSQHVAILRLKSGLLPVFASMYLSLADGGQREIARLQYGQTKPGLNFDQIREFRVPVPTLSQQQYFVNIVTQHERLRATQRESLRQAEHLFQTLLHRAFAQE